MQLGQKIKKARMDAGMSQRELCGERITRNMLSQIENGSAKPSLDTLVYICAKLGRPIAYFLDEDAAVSDNQSVMMRAREAYDARQYLSVLEVLESYRAPDLIFDREKALLEILSLLGAAKIYAQDGRELRAMELISRAREIKCDYCSDALKRECTLLLGGLSQNSTCSICDDLPSIDEELSLRARGALENRDFSRAAALADAVQCRGAVWYLLRGRIYLADGDYVHAEQCLKEAEGEFSAACDPLLEECYREMGDYRRAYFYACRQKRSDT